MNAPGAVAPADPSRVIEASTSASPQASTLSALGFAVDPRGVAVSVLATLACVFALSWAQSLIVPLLLGIVIAYTLNPVVSGLEAIRIPRVLATALVMLRVVAAVVLGAY